MKVFRIKQIFSEAWGGWEVIASLQQIMSHIKKILYNKYIFALLKGHQCHRQSYPHLQNVSIGDIVLLKDANLPRLCRWKELIAKTTKGQDGLSRGVS